MKVLAIAAGLSCVVVAGSSGGVTYSKHVSRILQKHCQECHRPGEVAPMPLLTYQQARPWAKAIRAAVITKKMPPWFADPAHGKFANDPALTSQEIEALAAWADAGAPEGDPKELPAPLTFQEGWTIGKPDVVLQLPRPLDVPASGTIEILYVVVPASFKQDRWVQAAEIRPGNRAVVHHVNAFLRAPDSAALRTLKPGEPYIPAKRDGAAPPPPGAQPASEVLVGFVPGVRGKSWGPGQAKFMPAGSDLILQLHYQPNGQATTDQTRVGLIFAKEPPKERVLSAVAKNWTFEIPAGAPNHEVRSFVEFGTDVKLVSLQPHMHYRGRDYEYKAVYPSGETEVLLRVQYDFNWQITYFLAEPKLMPKGTRIECTAHYDNSANNPHNPDPKATVRYGEQSWDEMMSGWMEIAFSPETKQKDLFVVRGDNGQTGAR